MPIEFTPEACTTIIEVTGLKPINTAAASELAAALNKATDSLLKQFERAPVTNTKAIRTDIRNMLAAIDRLRWRLGFSRYNLDEVSDHAEWAFTLPKSLTPFIDQYLGGSDVSEHRRKTGKTRFIRLN